MQDLARVAVAADGGGAHRHGPALPRGGLLQGQVVLVAPLRAGVYSLVVSLLSLLDLPLPGPEMLKVMKVLAEFFRSYASYDGLGRLYTRRSG